jgi:hypothetical protein
VSWLTLQNWEDVGGGATAIGVFVALVAAVITYFQYSGSKGIQREATAKQFYGRYLELTIEHPDMARGRPSPEALESEKYEWFVSYMLNACEQILESSPGDREWRSWVKGQIVYHKKYICDPRFKKDEYGYYSVEMKRLIDECCGNGRQE